MDNHAHALGRLHHIAGAHGVALYPFEALARSRLACIAIERPYPPATGNKRAADFAADAAGCAKDECNFLVLLGHDGLRQFDGQIMRQPPHKQN
jgi:hypothetical protein